MKTSGLRMCSVFVGCVVIVGCSQTWESSRLPYAANVKSVRDRGASSSSYRVLWSFGVSRLDGSDPQASVIDVGGTLYGTTYDGVGFGTVFSFVPGAGSPERTMHRFYGAGGDGEGPTAALIDVNGTLYGTTAGGGEYVVDGTVFSISKDGTEKVLHSFGGGTDGYEPFAALTDLGGRLYGTTYLGGAYRGGTVYSITTFGSERVLHSFGNGTDGIGPWAGLTDVRGTLYGTTAGGGAYGSGTVFSITTDGTEKVLHSFNGTDGASPEAELINVNGVLYGTTHKGGMNECNYGRCGTVFSITTDGREKVLHSFNGTDGAYPYAGLADVRGTLYGTTFLGGANNSGTVFSITTDGTEKVLHSFGSGTDGVEPAAGLYYKSGNLYGTTSSGGLHNGGTLFSLKP